MKSPLVRLFALLFLLIHAAPAVEKPNILWITSEDNASHWLGCYGNKQASTPRLDSLAAGGLRFTRAYSNAPVCAVARSTTRMACRAPAFAFSIPRPFGPVAAARHSNRRQSLSSPCRHFPGP